MVQFDFIVGCWSHAKFRLTMMRQYTKQILGQMKRVLLVGAAHEKLGHVVLTYIILRVAHMSQAMSKSLIPCIVQ
jgi:hypothetical protein